MNCRPLSFIARRRCFPHPLFSLVIPCFAVCLFFSSAMSASAADPEKEWWIMGTVKGNKIGRQVVTLKLLPEGGGQYAAVTSLNKYGQYAFSRPSTGGSPGNYLLHVFVGAERLMEVNLRGVKPGGRVPPISISW